MEAIFDDLSAALKEPRQDAWRPVRAFALDMAGKLAMGRNRPWRRHWNGNRRLGTGG